MFTSTSNTTTVNPFQYLSSSSSHNPFPFTVDQETNDFFLYNHNPLTVPFIPTNPSTTTNNSTAETLMINMAASANSAMLPSKLQDHVAVLNGDHHGQYNPCNFLPRKKPVKKHSHSKISTAQGLRDRRVRLSIEIARKFFDLQDMLGFDKASKTLEWLLSKSRKAIKELTQNGSQDAGAKSLSSSSTCDEVVSETVGDPEAEVVVSKSETSVAVDTEKKMKKPQKTTVDLLAKEMRAKARARARERTRVKMCNRRVHESKKCPDSNPQILNPSRPLTQRHQASDKSAGSYIQNINSLSSSKGVAAHVHGAEEPSPHQSLAIHVPKGNVVQESIVIKRKTKPSAAAIMGYQQNVVMLKDVSCSNSSMNNYLPNLPLPNWDINGTIARSSFCAITNMNLSAGFQLCGKLLEGENNQYHQ